MPARVTFCLEFVTSDGFMLQLHDRPLTGYISLFPPVSSPFLFAFGNTPPLGPPITPAALAPPHCPASAQPQTKQQEPRAPTRGQGARHQSRPINVSKALRATDVLVRPLAINLFSQASLHSPSAATMNNYISQNARRQSGRMTAEQLGKGSSSVSGVRVDLFSCCAISEA